MERNNKYSLDEIGNELPFTVPENYFEQFAAQMEKSITLKQISKTQIFKKWMMVAAVFVGLLAVGQLMYSTYSSYKQNDTENYEAYVLSQVNDAELMDNYVDELHD